MQVEIQRVDRHIFMSLQAGGMGGATMGAAFEMNDRRGQQRDKVGHAGSPLLSDSMQADVPGLITSFVSVLATGSVYRF